MTTKTIGKTPNRKKHFLFLFRLLIVLVTVLSTQCIEEYDPNLNTNVNLLAINGSIVRGQEEQTIVITRSTPVNETQYNAVTNCDVFVTDDRNNKFQFNEISAGKYEAKIDISYLYIGAKFKLTVNTPDNDVYESDYEEIQDCPSVDSLYFQEETNYSKEQKQYINGIRLNLDLHAREEYTKYYRWKINETWEYRSTTLIEKELVGVTPFIPDPTILLPVFYYWEKPDSLHRCWREATVNELFSASTLNLETNGSKRVPLHFIWGEDNKIYVRYCCLVSQYSLNEKAYNYWHNKEVEIKESGGMYFSQPSQSVSNIKNINNIQETVLGYFWTSSLKQKRIFFEGPYNPNTILPCYLWTLNVNHYFKGPDANGEFDVIDDEDFPVYVIEVDSSGVIMQKTGDKSCFDCRIIGGTIEQPDYW